MNNIFAHARNMLCAMAATAWALPAMAQTVPANVAVPFYTPPALMQGAYRQWFAPRASDLKQRAQALTDGVAQLCDAPANAPSQKIADTLARARMQWQAAALAWDRLSGVAIGPLLKRRSARQIDFSPTRPALIQRAIGTEPADATAMERIGTPAKGFAALEWLLWTQPVAPDTPGCRYAHQVALEIQREAFALDRDFGALAARDASADEAPATAAMGELINQWVGALERLRWASMEKPVRATGPGGRAIAFARGASGTTEKSWAAQWDGIRTLATAQGAHIPQPGADLVPLETYLRGRGLNPLANALANRAAQAHQALSEAHADDSASVLRAAAALAELKRLGEAEVAPALEVNLGFSDADGD